MSLTTQSYTSAFGVQPGGSYWMGLDAMHRQTSPCPASVRMEQLDDSGTQHFTYFKECLVGSPAEDYAARFIESTSDLPDDIYSPCYSLWGNSDYGAISDYGAQQNRASEGGWWWTSIGGYALTVPFSHLHC